MYINGILLGVLGTLFAEMALVLIVAIGYGIYTSNHHTPRHKG